MADLESGFVEHYECARGHGISMYRDENSNSATAQTEHY
jgi:hypothetical protein